MRTSVLSLILMLMAGLAQAQIPQIERKALIALYNSTDGNNWERAYGWLSGVGTECNWHGITCHDGHVQEVVLEANEMVGTLPKELGNLSKLTKLLLTSNQISGPIPSQLASLKELEMMGLVDNQLNGSIPAELALLSNLQYLQLGHNNLTGAIPSELGDLKSIRSLFLVSNQLGGPIPAELGNLSSLISLNLTSNNLNGSIPPELGNLGNLNTMYLGGNQLSGCIPPEIGNLSHLEKLYLHSNQLTGAIPSELGELDYLLFLHLSFNQLSGDIPPELGNLTRLMKLSLYSNRLSGGIPPELGNLTSLSEIRLESNQLSGEVPRELMGLYNMHSQYTNIGYNALWTDDPIVEEFLNSKDPDWAHTQTVAPAGLTVASVGDRTIWLEWTPIVYSGGDGGYEVFFEQFSGGPTISGGFTHDKGTSTFPVTALQPGWAYDLTVETFTKNHENNYNWVVSDRSPPEWATTTNTGCNTPEISVSGGPFTFTLAVTSQHDSCEWVTGDTSATIVVSPGEGRWFWVRTFGPGSCDEASVVFVTPPLFADGFESSDTSAWSAAIPG